MPRIRIPTALILQAIDNGFVFGFDVMRTTNLPSGTVYPALRRLEGEGLISSRWESEAKARRQGRPARRMYRLTHRGRRALTERAQNDAVVRGVLQLIPQKEGS